MVDSFRFFNLFGSSSRRTWSIAFFGKSLRMASSVGRAVNRVRFGWRATEGMS